MRGPGGFFFAAYREFAGRKRLERCRWFGPLPDGVTYPINE